MTFTGFAIGLVTFASTVTVQGTSAAQSTVPMALPIDKTAISAARYLDYSRRETVSEYVKEYFADTPILSEVAFCESAYRQTGLNGDVLRGNVDSADVGVMQINERFHGEKAKELGLDLETLEGNLEYAKYLYEREGLKPWKSSSKCWMKSEAYRNPSEA